MTTGTRRRRINCSQLDSSTFPVPTVCPSQFSVRDRWNICHYVSSGAEWKVARNRTETNRAGPARVGTWKMEAPRPTAGYEVSQMEKRDIGNVSNLLLWRSDALLLFIYYHLLGVCAIFLLTFLLNRKKKYKEQKYMVSVNKFHTLFILWLFYLYTYCPQLWIGNQWNSGLRKKEIKFFVIRLKSLFWYQVCYIHLEYTAALPSIKLSKI